MGSEQRFGEVRVMPAKRKRGGRLKKLEWRGHRFRLDVALTYGDRPNFYLLCIRSCSCKTQTSPLSYVEVADRLYLCGQCGGEGVGTLRLQVGEDLARLEAVLEFWGEDVLTAAIGASALMDAADKIAQRYRTHGLPDHVCR